MDRMVSISVLVEDTGESTRTLQHWSDLGILRPLASTHKQGRGRYREFPAPAPWHGERTWALLAAELNRLRIPLGDIKLILDYLREEPITRSDPIGKAIIGRWIMVEVGIDQQKEVRMATILDKEIAPSVMLKSKMFDIEGQEMVLHEDIPLKLPWDFAIEFTSAYRVNLSRVLSPLRK